MSLGWFSAFPKKRSVSSSAVVGGQGREDAEGCRERCNDAENDAEKNAENDAEKDAEKDAEGCKGAIYVFQSFFISLGRDGGPSDR